MPVIDSRSERASVQRAELSLLLAAVRGPNPQKVERSVSNSYSIACVRDPPPITSSRRFGGRRPLGIFFGSVRPNALFWVGVSPDRLAEIYKTQVRPTATVAKGRPWVGFPNGREPGTFTSRHAAPFFGAEIWVRGGAPETTKQRPGDSTYRDECKECGRVRIP